MKDPELIKLITIKDFENFINREVSIIIIIIASYQDHINSIVAKYPGIPGQSRDFEILSRDFTLPVA